MTAGPIPLVIAVTGHRDIRAEDVDKLSHAAGEFLESFRTRYPHSEVVVLTSLAEGADRLVARVALERGLKLFAALPLPIDEYKKDFSTPESSADFDALLARAANHFVVTPHDGVFTRPDCYARCGAYCVTNCHVLLALWNGLPSDKVGGTADMVRYRLEGIPPAYAGFGRMLDPVDNGLVHHLVTPRRSDPATEGRSVSMHLRAPEQFSTLKEAQEALERICRNTDNYNALAADPALASDRRKSEDWLMPAAAAQKVTADAQRLRGLYGIADALAIRFQRSTLDTHRALFWLVFGAVVGFELFAHGLEAIPAQYPVAFYVLFLAIALLVYKRGVRREIDRRYLDYRALAEGLRVQFYWTLAGVRRVVADYYMRYRLQDVEWIRCALRACDLMSASAPPAAASSDTLQMVAKDWVTGQRAFFERARTKDERRLHRLEQYTSWLTIFSITVGIAVAAYTIVRPKAWEEASEVVHFLFIAAIGLTSAGAALIHSYAEKRALSAHVKRYTRMTALFQSAEQAITSALTAGNSDTARDVLRELGREALEENADWVMLHRERPLEIPN